MVAIGYVSVPMKLRGFTVSLEAPVKATDINVAPGSVIRVRDEDWLVTSTSFTSSGTLVKVQGLSELVRDTEAAFYSDLDNIEVVDPRLARVVADDSPNYRRARLFLETTLRKTPMPATSNALSVSTRMLSKQLNYQRIAVAKALDPANIRPRILIADAVGLGKTLEIGMILSELVARGRGDNILIVTPRHVLEQMQHEMWSRFALPFVRLDSVGIQRVRQTIPASRNPFTYFKRAIISIDTLKTPRYREHLKKRRWDAVVIDESHNLTNAGTLNNELARILAPRTDALILASATPHNGKKESFAELVRLLDTTAVRPDGSIDQDAVQQLIIRRHRYSDEVAMEVGADWAERPEPRNKLVTASPAEDAVANELSKTWIHPLGNSPAGHQLFGWTLAKAFLSSPAALIATVDERLRKLGRADGQQGATTATNPLAAKEADALERLLALAQVARTQKSAKFAALVLFSTGFSKNDRGYLPLNFGPLNRSGGERRLNVAVTRARRQVIVFSSFDPTDLRAEETSSVGIKHLRSYLELAAHGPSALPFDGRRKPAVDRHREQIADALREQGFAVTTDVGLSDFKVDISVSLAEEPERPVMAVLLDSPAWASRATVGDRDGLPSDVLSRMLRWPAMERVWLPEWLSDSASVVERLVTAVRSAQLVDSPEPSEAVVGDGKVVGHEDAPSENHKGSDEDHVSSSDRDSSDADPQRPTDREDEFELVRSWQTATVETLPEASTYRPWIPRVLGGIEVLDILRTSSSSRTLVGAAMEQIIEAEGPIHTVRLAKLTCAEFSLNKVSSHRANSVLKLIGKKYFVDEDSFVWPHGLDSDTWRGYRENEPEVERKIEHVSKVEIANAMVAICRNAHGIDWEDLKRSTIRTFGGKRVTTGIGERLEAAARDAVVVGKLNLNESGLYQAL